MAKTLEAHDKLIREIFEGSYQFEILDYQRLYAWTTEQATEMKRAHANRLISAVGVIDNLDLIGSKPNPKPNPKPAP
jgi:hypothetical protein